MFWPLVHLWLEVFLLWFLTWEGSAIQRRGLLKTLTESEIGVHYKIIHIKISQFTKFEVLSLDCNHVESFQKNRQNKDFCMDLEVVFSE